MLIVVEEVRVDMFDAPVPMCCVVGPFLEIS